MDRIVLSQFFNDLAVTRAATVYRGQTISRLVTSSNSLQPDPNGHRGLHGAKIQAGLVRVRPLINPQSGAGQVYRRARRFQPTSGSSEFRRSIVADPPQKKAPLARRRNGAFRRGKKPDNSLLCPSMNPLYQTLLRFSPSDVRRPCSASVAPNYRQSQRGTFDPATHSTHNRHESQQNISIFTGRFYCFSILKTRSRRKPRILPKNAAPTGNLGNEPCIVSVATVFQARPF